MRLALILALAAQAFAQAPYNEKPTYARSRDFDLQHLKLELSFDLVARKIMGTATLRMAPLTADVRELTLDSGALHIESITVAGRKVAFQTVGDQLIVTLDRSYAVGAPLDFAIRYDAEPKRGLYFVFPDKLHPMRPRQIWANGDTAGGNNRYWFPLYDFPNDKTTTEMLVTVPSGWQTLSNGKLAGVTENKGAATSTFHWLQDKPMSTYLISLVAGEFDKGQDKWTVPVEYYVPCGRGGDIPRTFGRTVDMLEFFSTHIVPYPWAKYSQAMVDTFGGGMENTSATTEGASAILSAREFEDRKMGTDSLIAHEMAHQWFGDLVTCADWRHTWLNEGFATYFEALWEEHAYGRDVFDWREWQAARGMASPGMGATMSVVPKTDADVNGAYGLIYNKGGWTLHMLRGQLGDVRFWKAIQHYAQKFSYQTATTNDFVEAVAEATGQDVEWLFDEYVYKPGHPEFDFTWDYNAETRLLHVGLKQNQKVDGKVAPFRIPVEIEALSERAPESFLIEASGESQDFYFSMNERPSTVLLDPRDIVLKAVAYHKAVAEWIWQLEHAPRALNRLEAANQLGIAGGDAAVEALAKAGMSDTFYGVRVEAAQALGRIHSEAARDALMKMLADKKAEVRAAAAGSMGAEPKGTGTIERLLELARTDASLNVRQAALMAAARLHPAQGIELLKAFLGGDNPPEMRSAVAAALGQLGDEAAVEPMLELARDSDDRVRGNALRGFMQLGKGNRAVTDQLIAALDDGNAGDRQSAMMTLRMRGDQAAIPALERIAASDPVPSQARNAQSAADALRRPATPAASRTPGASEDLAALRARLAQLEKENTELKARMDRIEKK